MENFPAKFPSSVGTWIRCFLLKISLSHSICLTPTLSSSTCWWTSQENKPLEITAMIFNASCQKMSFHPSIHVFMCHGSQLPAGICKLRKGTGNMGRNGQLITLPLVLDHTRLKNLVECQWSHHHITTSLAIWWQPANSVHMPNTTWIFWAHRWARCYVSLYKAWSSSQKGFKISSENHTHLFHFLLRRETAKSNLSTRQPDLLQFPCSLQDHLHFYFSSWFMWDVYCSASSMSKFRSVGYLGWYCCSYNSKLNRRQQPISEATNWGLHVGGQTQGMFLVPPSLKLVTTSNTFLVLRSMD